MKRIMNYLFVGSAVVFSPLCSMVLLSTASAADEGLRDSQQTAIAEVNRRAEELKAVNKSIWTFAEVGLQEKKSSKLLADKLRSAGFDVKQGVAGMPTAFVASYGSGKPIVGILAEYDALPGMSQKVSPQREPAQENGNGHACGHSGLGTGALGAALAVKTAIDKHKIQGTVRLYGTPAEETLIGKVYMTLDGLFDDLDVCLHWHPSNSNISWAGSSKAMVSAKFTFAGLPAHASLSPHEGRSALDGVELMNVGANYMREHLKEDARVHYVVVDGGGAPNVVVPKATVWYFCRADAHEDVERNFNWLKKIAEGAALMSRTKLSIQVDTDCHEIIPNDPLAQQIDKNMRLIGAPSFTEQEKLFARRLQAPLIEQFGKQPKVAIAEKVTRLPLNPFSSKGSTDVGDISWRVPTGGFRAACFVSESPGHSWQNVAAIGSTIGEKGTIYAAKILAVTALDVLEQPDLVKAAQDDYKQKIQGKKYISFVPKGQKAPQKIR